MRLPDDIRLVPIREPVMHTYHEGGVERTDIVDGAVVRCLPAIPTLTLSEIFTQSVDAAGVDRFAHWRLPGRWSLLFLWYEGMQ